MSRYLKLSLVAVAIGLLLSGCSANQALVARSTYVDDHPELSEMEADAILNGQIMVGMSEEMVRASWGDPARVEDAPVEDASYHWVYGNYFVGGNITDLYFDEDSKLLRYEVNQQQAHANSGSGGQTPDESLTKSTSSGTSVLTTKESGGRP